MLTLVVRRQAAAYAVLLLTTLPVLADNQNDEPAYTLPTIIITPEWREVDLQQAPSTINTLTGQQLDSANVSNTQ